MIKIKEFKSNVFKNYKLMIFLMILLMICSLPLHIRTIESHPILDKNGFMAIQYQDGMLRVNDDSAAGTIFTDIGEMNKWKINAWKNEEIKIRKIYIGLFIDFADMRGQNIRKYRSNLWKIIIDCSFDKIYFLNNFL